MTRQLIGAAVTRPVLIPGFMVAALAAVPASAQEFSQAASETHQPKTDVAGAIGDSIKLLMIEHGTRIAFQEKTRRELRGPFWSDYRRSIRLPRRGSGGRGS